MESSLSLKVITPNKVHFEGPTTSVVAPGSAGYLGVLRNHAPLITTLTKGNLIVKNRDVVKTFKIEGGFLEVLKNQVLVLTDKVTT